MTQKLFFVSIIALIYFIGIIIHKLKMYTQDYLILYEASIGEKEIKGRILRQHRGFSKRNISARELELLEIGITRKHGYDTCLITDIIKLKSSFGKGERPLSDIEIEMLSNKPGPRLMK